MMSGLLQSIKDCFEMLPVVPSGAAWLELGANHTEAMLWKPNVYADISALTRLWPAAKLAAVLKSWLRAYPEKVLFGTDASSFGTRRHRVKARRSTEAAGKRPFASSGVSTETTSAASRPPA